MILIRLLTPDPPPFSFVSRTSAFLGQGLVPSGAAHLPSWLSLREELRDALALAPTPSSASTFHIHGSDPMVGNLNEIW